MLRTSARDPSHLTRGPLCPLRWLSPLLVVMALALALGPREARADGPAKSGGSAKVGTSGASSSGKSSKKDDKKKDGFDFPEFVYGGNAISFVSPLQFGIVGYQPKVRLGVQYDYQLYKSQWLYFGAAALLDNGDYRTFRTGCGLMGQAGRCDNGTVAGFDVYLGYVHKFYVKKHPWLVPNARAGGGFMWWRYPDLGGTRQQARVRTMTFTVRGGGGLRIFLLKDLGIGFDVNLQLGVGVNKDQPVGQDASNSAAFSLGIEVLPLILEYRF